MVMSDWRCLPIFLLGLVVPNAALAAKKPSEAPERVCVPAENGRDWECGTEDNPPPDRAPPPRDDAPKAAPAPDYLLAPHAAEQRLPSAVESVAEPERAAVETLEPIAEAPAGSAPAEPTPAPPASIAAPMDDPYAAERAMRAPPTAVEPSTASTSDTATAPPVASAIEDSGASSAATPAPLEPQAESSAAVDTEAARATEIAPATSAPAPPPEPVATPVTSAPLPVLAGAAEFLRLNGSAYTLQLALANDARHFPALAQSLGLDPAATFVLHIAGADGQLAILMHGEYADSNAARAALARMPAGAALQATWPRRIGPLHAELRRSGN